MKTQHTPGPWKTAKSASQVRNPDSVRVDIIGNSKELYREGAFIAGDILPGDAALIAAAPELLAALKDARSFIATITSYEASQVLERTWAPIFKAECEK